MSVISNSGVIRCVLQENICSKSVLEKRCIEENLLDTYERAAEARKKDEAQDQAELAKQKDEDAYWQTRNEAYFQKQRREALKRSQEAEAKQNRAFHESIAKDQAESRAIQAEIRKAHEIVDRFGGSYEQKRLSHKKIEELSKNADLDKAQKIKNAMRKQYYESRQLGIEAEGDLQRGKAEALKESSDFAGILRDTAITTNKILALPTVATASLGVIVGGEAVSAVTVSTTIPSVQGATTNAIAAVEKDGIVGGGVSLLKDATDEVTHKIGGEAIDKGYRIAKFYYGDGIEVPAQAKLYDKNHNLLKKVKNGERVYNDKGDDITYVTAMRLMRYKSFVEKAQEDFSKDDANKKANAALDIWSLTTSVTEKVLEIGKRIIK